MSKHQLNLGRFFIFVATRSGTGTPTNLLCEIRHFVFFHAGDTAYKCWRVLDCLHGLQNVCEKQGKQYQPGLKCTFYIRIIAVSLNVYTRYIQKQHIRTLPIFPWIVSHSMKFRVEYAQANKFQYAIFPQKYGILFVGF